MKRPLVILTGPTAAGKSALSLALAEAAGGEIISADSMQVYRGMDIGSAKLPEEERRGIPHHLLDVKDPSEPFDVTEFVRMAGEAAEGIYARGKLPILVGGTGFYLQAYTHLAVFGICFDADRGWVGEGIGAGVGAGYVLPLSSSGRWKLELGLQVGFFRCKYDPYQFENPVNPAYRDGLYYYKWTRRPELFKKRQYRWNWIGPTRIGVTLTYDLLYRRIQKKGVSLKSEETRVIETSKPRNFETSK